MIGVQTRLNEAEEQALLEVLREANSLATGPEGESLEKEFAAYLGASDAVARRQPPGRNARRMIQSLWMNTATGAAMKTRKIADMDVSTFCLGTMTFGTPVNRSNAVDLVHWALDHGINFIDTADMYEGYSRSLGSSGGIAEQFLGEALKDRRDRAVVITKAGNPVDGPNSTFDISPAHLTRQLDRSLSYMRTDYVDIFELHRPDEHTPLEESLGAVADFVKLGKARHWGFSNFQADQIRQMVKICDDNGYPRPVVSQPQFSWLGREAAEQYIPACTEAGIAVTPYRVLEGGLLTGKYRRGQPLPKDSRAEDDSGWLSEPDDAVYDRIEAFDSEADAAGLTPGQYALKWVLDQPGLTACVVGVKRIDQIAALMPGCE